MEIEPTRVIVCLAETIGEHLPRKFEILGLQSISHAMGSDKPVADYARVMDAQAAELVRVLETHLPQGTWSRVVAYVAQRWADDQAGWISTADYWGKPPAKDVADADQSASEPVKPLFIQTISFADSDS